MTPGAPSSGPGAHSLPALASAGRADASGGHFSPNARNEPALDDMGRCFSPHSRQAPTCACPGHEEGWIDEPRRESGEKNALLVARPTRYHVQTRRHGSMAEQRFCKPWVGGSTPSAGSRNVSRPLRHAQRPRCVYRPMGECPDLRMCATREYGDARIRGIR